MRRGQTHRVTEGVGFTKQELVDASGLSAKSFDTLRKTARIKGPSHGCIDWVFSFDDVKFLVRTAEGGRYTDIGRPAAQAWRAMLLERGIEMEAPRVLRGRAGERQERGGAGGRR